MTYFSHALGFCYSAQDIDFEEPELAKDVDVEVVLDTETMAFVIEPHRHMDMGSME